MFRLISYMTAQGLLLVLSQVLLKLGMAKSGELAFSRQSFSLVLYNHLFWLAGLAMAGAGIIWLHVLKRYPFSLAYPLVSISYIFSLFASLYVFREPVPLVRWVGVGVMILGIFLLTRNA